MRSNKRIQYQEKGRLRMKALGPSALQKQKRKKEMCFGIIRGLEEDKGVSIA